MRIAKDFIGDCLFIWPGSAADTVLLEMKTMKIVIMNVCNINNIL